MTNDEFKKQIAGLGPMIRGYVENFAQQVRPRLKEIDDLRDRVERLERQLERLFERDEAPASPTGAAYKSSRVS